MKVINLNTQENVRLTVFPDNQPHVNIDNIKEGDDVRVICSITNSIKLLNLLQCSNAIEHKFANKKELVIPYLMGARYDRIMNDGDSVDVEVISKLVNSCGFKKVILYDVHSDVAVALINNSVNVSNYHLVSEYGTLNSVLICPDAGAVKKVSKYIEWNPSITDVVYCNKTRNLSNGDLTLTVLTPDLCEGRDCVIIDDLCDGGGTFLGIASQIKPKSLTLIISHGIFSKTVKPFVGVFDKIITSDSYPGADESSLVTIIKNNW